MSLSDCLRREIRQIGERSTLDEPHSRATTVSARRVIAASGG